MSVAKITRRQVLILGCQSLTMGSGILLLSGNVAMATPEGLQVAIDAVLGGSIPKTDRVKLDLPPLVENGNSVPMTVMVDSPMTAQDYITDIHVFNERNPLPHIASFKISPVAGIARVSTRIKLAASQQITALARTSDGEVFVGRANVVVTLAACVEELN